MKVNINYTINISLEERIGLHIALKKYDIGMAHNWEFKRWLRDHGAESLDDLRALGIGALEGKHPKLRHYYIRWTDNTESMITQTTHLRAANHREALKIFKDRYKGLYRSKDSIEVEGHKGYNLQAYNEARNPKLRDPGD